MSQCRVVESSLEWIRRQLDYLSSERLFGELSPERQQHYEELCSAERRLLDARDGDYLVDN